MLQVPRHGEAEHGGEPDEQHDGGQHERLRHRRRERGVQGGREIAPADSALPAPGRTDASRDAMSAAIPALPSTAPTCRVVL